MKYNLSLLSELKRNLNHVRFNVGALGLLFETEARIIVSIRTALAELDMIEMQATETEDNGD